MKRKVILLNLFFCSCILFADISPDALRHYNEGMNFYNKNDFDSAIVEFTNAVAIFPEYADAYLELGNCYDNKSDQIKALENYLKAGKYDKRYIIFAYGYECASDNMENYDEAIVALSQCIDQKINSFVAYCMRGNSYGAKDDFNNAYNDYSAAIRISPNIFQPYFSRGALNIIMGNFQQAITDLEMSMRLYPDFDMASYFLDMLYEMFGDRSKLLL
jgi:tetratricopeptide (TPR) repeat protein